MKCKCFPQCKVIDVYQLRIFLFEDSHPPLESGLGVLDVWWLLHSLSASPTFWINIMMTSSNGNIFRVTGHLWGEFAGEFPAQRPATRSFDVFFDLHPNKRLSKQWWSWWFETPSFLSWRHCNGPNSYSVRAQFCLTHWDRVTYICVSNLIIIGSDNGLSPGRRQAIIWTNTGLVFIGPLRNKFQSILIEIHTFSFKKIHLKMPSQNAVYLVIASKCQVIDMQVVVAEWNSLLMMTRNYCCSATVMSLLLQASWISLNGQ